MTRKKPADVAAAEAPEAEATERPSWFDEKLHRVEPRGIVLAATGDLLAEDGLPVNAAARRQWEESDAAEAATVSEQPPATATIVQE
ncbi:MAG: hypothetical protein KGQ52_13835 [Alphaproteobacteria bacterium]|nr:hypothetical protein [Alphaproteobacteria bacterium]